MGWKDDETRKSFERMSSANPPSTSDSDLLIVAINRLNRAVLKAQAFEYDEEFQDHFVRAMEMISWVATNVWAREERDTDHPVSNPRRGSMKHPQFEEVADKLARALAGNDGDDLGCAKGEGALHIALDLPIREAIEDVYADCGDSTPGVLSTNIAKSLAWLLPPAIISAFVADQSVSNQAPSFGQSHNEQEQENG